MGNIEAALAAAFPKNSWHRTFKAFKLPSPCSNRKSDRASQEQIKGMLVRLFEGAGYEEAARGKMWSQWLRLLPAAEASFQAGLTSRQAWARASRDFPELPHGRDAVNLFLGCVHTTGETERFLKVLAGQNDGERATQLSETLNDLLVVHRHAPPLEEVSVEVRQPGLTGKSVQAKGTYLPRVCKTYKEHFSHGRRFRKARKQRRDKGTQRDEKKLEKMRVARGAPEPEAVFYRKRDRQVDAAMKLAPQERAQKLRRTALGAVVVPVDTDLFVGDSVKAARAQAAERERRKEAAIEATHAAGKAGGEIAMGRRVKPGLTGSAGSSQTRWAKELPGDVREDSSAKRDVKKGQLVLLEDKDVKWPSLLSHDCGWEVCHKWPTWLKNAFTRSANLGGPEGYKRRSIVQRRSDDNSTTALCGRLVGGFLTTAPQVVRSQYSRNQAAQGVWYKGVACGGQMTLWLSPELQRDDALKVPLECLEALYKCGKTQLSLVTDLGKLQRDYKTYQEEKGTRSKPWARFAALVADEAECNQRTSPQFPRLVRTFRSWLAERSPVIQGTPPLVFW